MGSLSSGNVDVGLAYLLEGRGFDEQRRGGERRGGGEKRREDDDDDDEMVVVGQCLPYFNGMH